MTSDAALTGNVSDLPDNFFSEVPQSGDVNNLPPDFFIDSNKPISGETFREDTGEIISAPSGLSGGQVSFLDDVDNKGSSSQGFWGFTKLAGSEVVEGVVTAGKALGAFGVGSLADLRAGTVLSLSDQITQGLEVDADALRDKSFRGEKLTDDEARFLLRESARRNNLFGFLFDKTEDVARRKAQKAVAIGDTEEISRLSGKAIKLKKSANKIKAEADSLIERRFSLGEDDDFADKAIYIGTQGVASLGVSIGSFLVTKNAAASTLIFKQLQESGIYLEAREAGVGIEKSRAKAELAGFVEAALEFVGTSYFFKIAENSKGVVKHLRRAVEEALQEVFQTTSEEVITQTSGIRKQDIEGALQRIAISGLVGGVIGGGASTALDLFIKESSESEGIPEELVRSFNDKVQEKSDDIIDTIASDIESEADPIKMNKDKQSTDEALSVIEKFSRGEPIDEEAEVIFRDAQISADESVESLRGAEDQMAAADQKKIEAFGEQIEAAKADVKSRPDIKSPVIDFIKKRGGVEVGSPVDAELRSMGVTPQTAPALFKKEGSKGAIRDLDNFPQSEFDSDLETVSVGDGTFVDKNFVLEKLDDEIRSTAAATSAKIDNAQGFIEDLARLGLDIDTVTDQELFEASEGRLPVAPIEFTAAGAPVEPIVTDAEIKAVNPEFDEGLDIFLDEEDSILTQPTSFIRDTVSAAGGGLEKILTPISTRIGNISEALKFRLRQFELGTKVSIQRDEKVIVPFLKKWNKINERDKNALDLALKNGDDNVVDVISDKYGMQKEMSDVRSLLDDLHARAKSAGIEVNYRSSFFPRNVNDVEGLLGYLRENENWSVFNTAFDAREKKIGRRLTANERAEIANVMIRGFPVEGVSLSKKGIHKDRTIEKIHKEINQFYDTSDQSLLRYIVVANESIEISKLFGRGVNMNEQENITDSVGAFVDSLLESGEISSQNAKELKDLFNARFNRGRMGAVAEVFKDLGYLATMGSNVGSTITQIGDTFLSAYKNGLLNTAMSLPAAVTGNTVVSLDDIGITRIAQEFENNTVISSVVEKAFAATGLTAIDKIGKRAIVEGSYKKNRKLARKGDTEFMSKLDIMFGKENSAQVAQDFVDGNVTDDVKFVLFNDLLDMQPVALSEMPEQYLKSGNGKLFYMLKTFTIKQLDIYRRDVFREIRIGTETGDKRRVVKGMSNFIRLMGYMIMAGATRDMIWSWMTGQEPDDPDDIVIKNMLKAVGLSKYTFDQMSRPYLSDTPGDALFASTILLPTKTTDNMWRDIQSLRSKKGLNFKDLRTLRSVPVGGELYYFWFGGGSAKSKSKKKDKKGGNF